MAAATEQAGRRRRPSSPGRHALAALVLPAVCGLIVALAAGRSGLLEPIEYETVKARFELRGDQPPPKDVVIVAIDEDGLRRLKVAAEFSRTIHAELLDRLRVAKPRVIAYDVQFIDVRPREDPELLSAVGRARPVVLAAPDEVQQVLGSTAAVEKLHGYVGVSKFTPTLDAYLARVTATKYGVATFAYQAAWRAGARPPLSELDGKGSLIDFVGGPGTIEPLDFVDVLHGKVSSATLRDKVVVVGGTYESGRDYHATPSPDGGRMAGVEIQANAIATLLSGVSLRDAQPPIEWLVLVAACLAGAFAGWRGGPLPTLLLTAAGLIAYGGAAQLAFDGGTVLSMAPAGVGLLASTLAAVGLEQLAGRRERARLVELVERLAPGEDPDRVIERVAGAVLVPGTSLGGYRIVGLLGLGGMGVVYRAHQDELDRPVAIKVMAPALASDPSVRERLRREALSAARLDHPNVVAVYDAGGFGGRAYIAMALVEGRALSDLVGLPDMTSERVGAVVEMVAAALDHAHARGVVHRDVKPHNILVEDATGRALLTDFGIAAAAGQDRLTSTGDVVGTVAYAAPEQLAGAEPDRLVDVYALGCVVFELLTGHVPFERQTLASAMYAHMTEPPPHVSSLRPDLADSGIDAAVTRALAKDPHDRWQSAGDLARAVQEALAVPAARTPGA
jgi:CHASE2 domain-containing sensor protein/predicted Ser/Thr protein kinase